MKKHKFKVWKKDEGWCSEGTWNKSRNGIVTISPAENCEICVWTGMQDDKKQDIYEGDILMVMIYGQYRKMLIKSISQGAALINEDDCHDFYYRYSDIKHYSKTLIGNKFENPELLND